MNFTKNLKRTKIKKECIKQKFNWIVKESLFVLFFHYTGSKNSNWEMVKKEIFTKPAYGENFNCRGLVVPSNLSSLLQSKLAYGDLIMRPADPVHMCVNRFLGSTLLIGCESMEQVCALVEACKAPTFYCVGALYGQANMLTHLDIKRCISLSKDSSLLNEPQMTKKAKMYGGLVYSLEAYGKDWLLNLQRSLHFNIAPVHLMLHNALSFLALKKKMDSSY